MPGEIRKQGDQFKHFTPYSEESELLEMTIEAQQAEQAEPQPKMKMPDFSGLRNLIQTSMFKSLLF